MACRCRAGYREGGVVARGEGQAADKNTSLLHADMDDGGMHVSGFGHDDVDIDVRRRWWHSGTSAGRRGTNRK